MKSIKIVVRTKGLFVYTKDLNMGLKVLNQVAEHGIMKHTMIPTTLLRESVKMIGVLSNQVKKYVVDSLEEKIKKSKLQENLQDFSRKINMKYVPKFTKKSIIPMAEKYELTKKINNKNQKNISKEKEKNNRKRMDEKWKAEKKSYLSL